jgi:flagellar basal-body rod modification protein FlgD
MQINPMASSAGTTPAATNPAQSTNDMFLQILTAQLKNQDPLNPVDPTAFTSQLVQFNMLDQLAQINQTLKNAYPQGPAATSGANQTVQGAR